MKRMTLSEAEAKRRKAVEFLRRIGEDERAEDFEAMTPESYADHKGVELIENPAAGAGERRKPMATGRKSLAVLEAELDEANEYIAELEEKLDDIAGIVEDDPDEEDGGEEE